MAYIFSNYVRDGISARLLTPRRFFGDKRGYAYEWGIFRGGELTKGLKFSLTYEECTLPHLRPLPFGERQPCHMAKALYGTFVDGREEGYCHGLDTNGFWYTFGFFHEGENIGLNAFKEQAEKEVTSKGVTLYRKEGQLLSYTPEGELLYVGECDPIGLPSGYGVDFTRQEGRGDFAYYEMGDPSHYLNTPVGEEHPIYTPTQKGFSTQTHITHLRRGVKYLREEGMFENGVLQGLGAREWEITDESTHPHYEQEGGIFQNGKLIWGYHIVWDNGEWESPHPDYLHFVDGRPESYQETRLEGNENEYYIGEAKDGLPCGIGTLYQGDKKILGMWKAGVLHGWGCVFVKRGEAWLRQEDGVYIDGELAPEGLCAYCKNENIPFV